MDGTGQTVGLIEFDNFHPSDVSDYVNLFGLPAKIGNLSEVNVGGGAAVGSDEPEVLLDIDAVMTIAPGAKVVVYDAPFTGPGTSFQALFNAAIDGGSTIISNSWAYCEDQTTLADVESIDSIFQSAAASNISIFNGAGDSGTTCLDGSANTVAVPADSPNATAVGGSSLTQDPLGIYQSETWWNGTNATPPTGQGGYGVSKFFTAPTYQSGLSSSTNRSVPDVVFNADPAKGLVICQADNGGCPTGLSYGGTSVAAPQWAAFAALLNESQGKNLGFLNPLLYTLAGTAAFHDATSMGSDFSHVGLGSPNVDVMQLMLSGQTAGAVDATISEIRVDGPDLLAPLPSTPNGIPADGSTQIVVAVILRDSNGNTISGKTVKLSASAGSHAVVTPTSAVTNVTNGVALFKISDSTPENMTLIANDTTDGITLTQTPATGFVTPLAASASLTAGPSQVTADGKTPADITVTLEDSLGRPTPGKLIQINQTGGNSVISGPNPPVTNTSGQIEFTAVDSNNETITYSAVDVTDGNLPFPQTGSVTFSSAPEPGCSNTFVAAPGFVAQPYATGFIAQNFCVGNVCVSGCPGAFGLAFDGSGNLFVVDQPTGDIYKIPPGGGVANSSTLLNSTALPTLDELAIDSQGNLYGGLNETGNSFTNGAVVQINPSSGSVSRTVASGLTCPGLISIDPLSGDIFADDNCSGGGLNNASLWRISNPTSASPAVSVYATLPGSPNGTIAFAANGTIYIPTDGGEARLRR